MRKLIFIGTIIFLLLTGSAVLVMLNNRSEPSADLPSSVASEEFNFEPLKLIIREEAIYEVDLADLGLDGVFSEDYLKSNLLLSNQGQPVSCWIANEGTKLRFFGKQLDHPYSLDNVFWISDKGWLGENLQTVEEPTTNQIQTSAFDPELFIDLPENSYLAVKTIEENGLYNPLVDEGDHWFWLNLPAPVEEEFEFSLSAIQPGPAKIRVRVWGTTDSPGSVDHHLILKLNQQIVADELWDGKGAHIIEADLPVNLLMDGTNRLSIQVPGDMEVLVDILMLDWIELNYPRKFQAEDDRLFFISPGGLTRLSGFSGFVDIYDITHPNQAVLIGERMDPKAGFQTEVGHSYLVVGPRGYEKVKQIDPMVGRPDLWDVHNGADYLAVGPEELLDSIDPLLDLRRQEGLDSQRIPLQAIYDQFNQGIPDPQAIRRFLGYASNLWKKAPRYLLLVGDGSYDPKGYLSPPEANQVPTFFVQTQYGGQTASDLGYIFPGNEPWETILVKPPVSDVIAVGRIPARTSRQVQNYVEKIIAYEKQNQITDNDSEWTRRVLAIADGQDPVFRLEADNLLKIFSRSYATRMISPEKDTPEVNQEVIKQINDGSKFIIYIGHGSINMWGKDRLFSIQDISGLSNESRLPIVLNFTCLNGLFTHPTQDSLAEAFLWELKGGAIAVLAPTSLTLSEDQSYLSNALSDAIIELPGGKLGDILNKARLTAAENMSGSQDVINTFLLFGDPALNLVDSNP